jgi:serine/threonine protein kinase
MTVVERFQGTTRIFEDAIASLSIARDLDRQQDVIILTAKQGVTREIDINHPAFVRSIERLSPSTLVLESFGGVGLQTLVDAGQVMEPVLTFSVARQIAAGLDFLHDCGLVHGCLRPNSILLDTQNVARVVDLSLQVSETLPSHLATCVQYVPPEYLVEGSLCSASDQFSLAVLTYVLLYGRVPFSAPSLAECLFQVAYGNWDNGDSRLGARMREVLSSALAKEPVERFATCLAMVHAIEEAWSVRPAAATRLADNLWISRENSEIPTGLDTPSQKPLERRYGRASWVVALWAVAFLLAVASYIFARDYTKMSDLLNSTLVEASSLEDQFSHREQIGKNGFLAVINPSTDPIEILDADVGYWKGDRQFRSLSSVQYGGSWTVPPSSRQILSLAGPYGPVWDGSVVFYSLRLRIKGKEYVLSGKWDKVEKGTLRLPEH